MATHRRAVAIEGVAERVVLLGFGLDRAPLDAGFRACQARRG